MTCDRAVLVMRTSGEQKRQKVQELKQPMTAAVWYINVARPAP